VIAGFSTKTRFSRSLQLGGEAGTPVKAAASGRVVYSGDGLVGFGNLVIISHDNQFLSAYGHNQALLVKVGDVVNGGEIIARMGSTGTDRVKLHFEVRKEGTPVNPADLLPTRG
jgi:Membrane proteins related to metalloendopeptidases